MGLSHSFPPEFFFERVYLYVFNETSLRHLGNCILSFCVCRFGFSSFTSSFGGSFASSTTSFVGSGSSISSFAFSIVSSVGVSSFAASLLKSITFTLITIYSTKILLIFYI